MGESADPNFNKWLFWKAVFYHLPLAIRDSFREHLVPKVVTWHFRQKAKVHQTAWRIMTLGRRRVSLETMRETFLGKMVEVKERICTHGNGSYTFADRRFELVTGIDVHPWHGRDAYRMTLLTHFGETYFLNIPTKSLIAKGALRGVDVTTLKEFRLRLVEGGQWTRPGEDDPAVEILIHQMMVDKIVGMLQECENDISPVASVKLVIHF